MAHSILTLTSLGLSVSGLIDKLKQEITGRT
jgi:hypothetical protein